MKNWKIVKVELNESELESITCSICKVIYDDCLELQEFLSFYNHCGYGSLFGDGNTINIDICQHCLKEKFGKYVELVK